MPCVLFQTIDVLGEDDWLTDVVSFHELFFREVLMHVPESD